jgi:hypothetical protein
VDENENSDEETSDADVPLDEDEKTQDEGLADEIDEALDERDARDMIDEEAADEIDGLGGDRETVDGRRSVEGEKRAPPRVGSLLSDPSSCGVYHPGHLAGGSSNQNASGLTRA